MKFFITLGGFLGFALVVGVGLLAGRRSPSLLLEASMACVLGALLARWWHRLFMRSVQISLLEQRLARTTKKPGMSSAEKPQPAKL